MAGPPELVAGIARATGLPPPTVTDIDRRLVAAGLRSKNGRGRNAARMTPLDAARLLTAVLGGPQANKAAEAVERYAATRVDRDGSSAQLFSPIEDLASLSPRHSFVTGLAGLIDSAGCGSLAALNAAADDGHYTRIEVYALTRAVHGRIRLTGLPKGLTASLEYVPTGSRGHSSAATGDLEQSRRISERTIYAIAELLREEDDHD